MTSLQDRVALVTGSYSLSVPVSVLEVSGGENGGRAGRSSSPRCV
jgi:hypothetical protein